MIIGARITYVWSGARKPHAGNCAGLSGNWQSYCDQLSATTFPGKTADERTMAPATKSLSFIFSILHLIIHLLVFIFLNIVIIVSVSIPSISTSFSDLTILSVVVLYF